MTMNASIDLLRWQPCRFRSRLSKWAIPFFLSLCLGVGGALFLRFYYSTQINLFSNTITHEKTKLHKQERSTQNLLRQKQWLALVQPHSSAKTLLSALQNIALTMPKRIKLNELEWHHKQLTVKGETFCPESIPLWQQALIKKLVFKHIDIINLSANEALDEQTEKSVRFALQATLN